MYEEIDKLIHAVPFRAFTVFLTDQRKFPVPTRDHVLPGKKGALLFIQDDAGLVDIISLRNIASARVVEDAAAA
jgi:hypothetical protein